MRWLLRSKIHKARVTGADVDYVGSIAIDRDLIERSKLWVGEKVLVVSNATGVRLETYVIAAPKNSGVVTMNGAAARLIKAGEEIIVMGFELSDRPVEPVSILVDQGNRFSRFLDFSRESDVPLEKLGLENFARIRSGVDRNS